LGTSAQWFCALAPATWGAAECVSDADNATILLTFAEEELEEIVREMKTETRPRWFPGVFLQTLLADGEAWVLTHFE
jgi:hypothetical protein